MERLVECVPNFSEGRRIEVIDAIVAAITDVPGIYLLGREMDPDHNRAVVTFVGAPDAVSEAAFNACARAAELIDMTSHTGVHPRIGATDVIPFIPIAGVSMTDCVALARTSGARIADRLDIPVFLYGEAARRPERKDLAEVRKGEYEGLKTAILEDPARAPDFGPRRLHPAAGAVAVGARNPLIAYNVNLHTADLKLARRIARKIRERNGGLKGVRALGFPLPSRGMVQVSMNLTDPSQTSLAAAFEAVRREAEQAGVKELESELVGLVGLDALIDTVSRVLRLSGFDRSRLIEHQIWEADRAE